MAAAGTYKGVVIVVLNPSLFYESVVYTFQ